MIYQVNVFNVDQDFILTLKDNVTYYHKIVTQLMTKESVYYVYKDM